MTREEFNKVDVAFKAIREFGFPTFMLIAVGTMLWFVGAALHESVVVPLVVTHTEFMKATRETQAQQAGALESLAENKDDSIEILKSIADGQEKIHDELRAIRTQPSIGAPRK